jgi:heterodisulfide reductase subunit B2
MSRYALFLGCTIPIRARNYEMSARETGRHLGIEWVDFTDFTCCGFPAQNSNSRLSWSMSFRNLAIAESHGLEIGCLCSACTAMLTEALHLINGNHPDIIASKNALDSVQRSITGHTRVRHFIRILLEDIGLDKIRDKISHALTGIRILPHYGCHYLKPSEIYDGFDPVENPESLDILIQITGAESIRLPSNKLCCGGSVLAFNKNVAYQMAAQKLALAKSSGIDAICLICPFCGVMYDDNQKSIETALEKEFGIPVIYYPQLLGLAMGIDSKLLGLNLNKVKPTNLLEKINGVRP